MKPRIATVLAMLFVATAAFAHGGATHVMGTVIKISSSTIEVKTTKGDTKQVMFNDKTTFTKAGTKINATDLKEGDRVVIETHESKSMKGMFQAESVKVGSVKGQTVAKEHSHSH